MCWMHVTGPYFKLGKSPSPDGIASEAILWGSSAPNICNASAPFHLNPPMPFMRCYAPGCDP